MPAVRAAVGWCSFVDDVYRVLTGPGVHSAAPSVYAAFYLLPYGWFCSATAMITYLPPAITETQFRCDYRYRYLLVRRFVIYDVERGSLYLPRCCYTV